MLSYLLEIKLSFSKSFINVNILIGNPNIKYQMKKKDPLWLFIVIYSNSFFISGFGKETGFINIRQSYSFQGLVHKGYRDHNMQGYSLNVKI